MLISGLKGLTNAFPTLVKADFALRRSVFACLIIASFMVAGAVSSSARNRMV